jgi:transposase
MAKLGDEAVYRGFFKTYLAHVARKAKTSKHSILIDSTGLPNESHMEMTAANVHNGVRSNEIRLILAVDRKTGYPLFFRYVKGNVLDVSSLANTMTELAQCGVEVDHCILDAGYYCGDNIDDLHYWEIPYLFRLRAGNLTYKGLVKSHVDGLDTYDNRTIYGNRVVFIKQVPIEFHGGKAFAYVAIDHDVQAAERRSIYNKPPSEFGSVADRDEQLRNSGVFILISKRPVDENEILPLYYSRQAIEQTFDFGKNYANLLPLRTHSEETFRGHLLISFMATVSIMAIDKMFTMAHPRAKNKKPINFIQARSNLRQMKCRVYDDYVYVTEPDRKSNDILKALRINCDLSIKR